VKASWIYFCSVVIAVIFLLWIQFLVVLRFGSGYMKHVKASDVAEEHEKYWSQVVGVGVARMNRTEHASEALRRRAAHAAEASLNGTPSVKPNFTYKMKIVLGLIQIVTSLVVVLDSPLPNGFKKFMSWFGLLNLDLFQASGTECIVSSNYYVKFLVVALTPVNALLPGWVWPADKRVSAGRRGRRIA
jgi:hypothetical protein